LPTKAPPDVLDRARSLEATHELREVARPLLQEVVDHGAALFARCARPKNWDGPKLAVVLPYHHLIEMIDGVQILTDAAAPVPARLQLRSAFEAMLAILYITAEDSERRAKAYIVSDTRKLLAVCENHDPATDRGRNWLKRVERDSATRRIPVAPPDVAREHAESVRSTLRDGLAASINEAFEALREHNKREPAWHQLWGGPGNLADLAENVGFGGLYQIIYSPYSATVHAADVSRKLTATDPGTARIKSMRDCAELPTNAAFATAISLVAAKRMLQFFRPEEIPAFRTWYESEVRHKLEYLKNSVATWTSDLDAPL
jgi:hypothetical protein